MPSTNNGRGSLINGNSSENSVSQPKTVVKRQCSLGKVQSEAQRGPEAREKLDRKGLCADFPPENRKELPPSRPAAREWPPDVFDLVFMYIIRIRIRT